MSAASRVIAPVVASSIVLSSSAALAEEPAKRKVLAVHVEGNFAAESRQDILSILPDHIDVADAADFPAALKKVGLGKPMGSAMTQAKTRDSLMPRLEKAAQSIAVDGVIVGIVQRYAGKWRVYVAFFSTNGDMLFADAVSREGSEADRRSALDSAISSALAQFAPKPKDKPENNDKPTPANVEKSGGDEDQAGEKYRRLRHDHSSSLLSVEAGIEVAGRMFDYSDGLSSNLRAYELIGAPVGFAAVEIYPAASTGVSVLRDLGLTGSYARAFALQSKTADGDPVNTLYQRFSVGLRFRIPIDKPKGPVIGLSGQYYGHTFQVDELPELAGQVPNVDYRGIRAGVDVRFLFGSTSLITGIDWIEPLSAGAVYDRFTGAGVHGIAARAGFDITAVPGFQLRLGAEYTRFFADFDPVLGDAYVAGGALDQYLGLRLAAAYLE